MTHSVRRQTFGTGAASKLTLPTSPPVRPAPSIDRNRGEEAEDQTKELQITLTPL